MSINTIQKCIFFLLLRLQSSNCYAYRMIRSHRYLEKAFALPTILIASVVMIIVMLASIQSVVSIRIGLDNQYYDKIGQEAAESGATMAAACIKAGTTSWSSPLRPGTDCNGS